MQGKLFPSAPVRPLLVVLAALLTAPWSATAAAAERDTYLVQTVLLVAEAGGSSSLDGLSEPVRRAVAQVDDLLPTADYRLHDAGVVRVSRSAAIGLRGSERSSYLAKIDLVSPGKGAGQDAGQGSEVRFVLHDLWRTNDGLQSRELLATTFTLRPGEPTVVGTSQLGAGGGTLVVLMTLLPEST